MEQVNEKYPHLLDVSEDEESMLDESEDEFSWDQFLEEDQT